MHNLCGGLCGGDLRLCSAILPAIELTTITEIVYMYGYSGTKNGLELKILLMVGLSVLL